MHIDLEVAHHLGILKKKLIGGDNDESDTIISDKMQFVIDCDNSYALPVFGSEKVKHTDLVSVGELLTILVSLGGGSNEIIEDTFIILTKKTFLTDICLHWWLNYVGSLTVPKVLMNMKLIPQMFNI